MTEQAPVEHHHRSRHNTETTEEESHSTNQSFPGFSDFSGGQAGVGSAGGLDQGQGPTAGGAGGAVGGQGYGATGTAPGQQELAAGRPGHGLGTQEAVAPGVGSEQGTGIDGAGTGVGTGSGIGCATGTEPAYGSNVTPSSAADGIGNGSAGHTGPGAAGGVASGIPGTQAHQDRELAQGAGVPETITGKPASRQPVTGTANRGAHTHTTDHPRHRAADIAELQAPAGATAGAVSKNTDASMAGTHTGGSSTHTPVEGVTRTGVPATSASIYSTGPGTGHTGAMTTGQRISSWIPGTEANWQKKVAKGKI